MPFDHVAAIYHATDEFLNLAVPFVETALAAGDPVLVVLADDTLDALVRAVGDHGEGLVGLRMEEVGRNPGRVISFWERFVGHGLDGKRTRWGIEEPLWSGRSADEIVECGIHERLIDLAFEDSDDFRLLCAFDADVLDDATAEAVNASHRRVMMLDDRTVGRTDGAAFRPVRAADVFGAPLPPRPHEASCRPIGDESMSGVRFQIGQLAWSHGLTRRRAHDLEVSVSELVANTVMYAGGAGELWTWTEGPAVVCEVHDRGRLDDLLVGRRTPASMASHGRGLWLVHELCDLVQVRSDEAGTTVRVRMQPL